MNNTTEPLKAGLNHTQLINRAGLTSGNRPSFTIMNICTITYLLPKWYVKLVQKKLISATQVERQFRFLKEALLKNDLELVNYSLYEEQAFIIVKSMLDGHPRDARNTLKSQLRLWNVTIKTFLEPFRSFVWNLNDYVVGENGKIRYAPISPNKGKKIANAKKELKIDEPL